MPDHAPPASKAGCSFTSAGQPKARGTACAFCRAGISAAHISFAHWVSPKPIQLLSDDKDLWPHDQPRVESLLSWLTGLRLPARWFDRKCGMVWSVGDHHFRPLSLASEPLASPELDIESHPHRPIDCCRGIEKQHSSCRGACSSPDLHQLVTV